MASSLNVKFLSSQCASEYRSNWQKYILREILSLGRYLYANGSRRRSSILDTYNPARIIHTVVHVVKRCKCSLIYFRHSRVIYRYTIYSPVDNTLFIDALWVCGVLVRVYKLALFYRRVLHIVERCDIYSRSRFRHSAV